MANNRMSLQCTVCQERFPLAKYYPSSGWYATTGAWDSEGEAYRQACARKIHDFTAFLEKHSQCSDQAGTMHGPLHFALSLEQPEPFDAPRESGAELANAMVRTQIEKMRDNGMIDE